MDAAKTNQVVLAGCIIGWIILLSANPSRIAVLALNLTADSMLENNDNATVIACPGEMVVFTCQTTGSLAWRSDEYIGRGGNQFTFGLDEPEGSIAGHNESIYAELIDTDNGIITSTFYIRASLSSSVTCAATDYTRNYSTIYIRILDRPDVPEDLIAIQIRDTRYETCFIPVMWKNSANSVEARVTHYTININQYFMSNQTANLSSTAYSILFATECTEKHTLSVDISATNVCGVTGLRAVYRTQGQDPQCPIDIDTSSCDAKIPTILSPAVTINDISIQPTRRGYSEQNHGNILLIIVSGTVVATMTYLLGSLYT